MTLEEPSPYGIQLLMNLREAYNPTPVPTTLTMKAVNMEMGSPMTQPSHPPAVMAMRSKMRCMQRP